MRKYIPQATYENFVYPNNNIAIYDNNDVVQDINSNEITGTVSGFTTSLSGTTLTISFNYTWNRNGGQVFINQADRLHLFSVHMMTPSKTYYHPWRLVDYKYVTGTTQNSYTGSYTTSVTAAQFGEAFTSGIYTFEIRFIGALNTDVVCATSTIAPASSPTPTPTVTSSPGSPVSSPTPTPSVSATSGLTPTPTSSPGTSPTPTPTLTPTNTPSPTPPGVYYSFNITGGWETSGEACLEGTAVYTIYGATASFLDNAIFYDTPYLTTPFAGENLFYKNTGTNQWTQITHAGENAAEGTC